MICWFCRIVIEGTSDNRCIGWLCVDGNLSPGQSINWPYSSQASLWLYSSQPQPLDQCVNGGKRQLDFKSYQIQTSLLKDFYPVLVLKRGARFSFFSPWAGSGEFQGRGCRPVHPQDHRSFPGSCLHQIMLGDGGTYANNLPRVIKRSLLEPGTVGFSLMYRI